MAARRVGAEASSGPGKARRAGKDRSFLETDRFGQNIKVRLPVLTVTGKRPGPLLLVTACQHGRELNGIASIDRVYTALDPACVTGTVVFLPIMNPVAARQQRQDYPVEETRYRSTGIRQGHNMNRKWTASRDDDTYAASVADVVYREHLRHADALIDLHGWSGQSLCLAWSEKKHSSLLRDFGLPWSLVDDVPPQDRGLLENAARDLGLPTVTAELVPQNRLDTESIGFGERGILNTMKHLGMVPGRVERPAVQYFFSQKSHVETALRSPVEGVAVPLVRKGEHVRKGQVVARVLSFDTLEAAWLAKAPHAGVVFNTFGIGWGEDCLPSAVVYPGSLVALLKKPTRVVRRRP